MKTGLHIYAFWHMNLAFSSIQEDQRSLVLNRCYWPLIRLAKKHGVPFGFEMTGYTVEEIARLDSALLQEIGKLFEKGSCTLVGSGYAQIIGPLVPFQITQKNLELGHHVYEKYFGIRPRIALLNEQAYSSGIMPLYSAAGYDAIIMEWNNPARVHSNWPRELAWFPQRARGVDGKDMPVIWNDSLAFQNFQYYAHAERSLEEYVEQLFWQASAKCRLLSLYGSDTEIFNFRPKRFEEEAEVVEDEWRRIDRLLKKLGQMKEIKWTSLAGVLEWLTMPGANISLQLESSDQPVPVKKQGKYNIARWAVTGRADYHINCRCCELMERLVRVENPRASCDEMWRELCCLWDSDYRTFITAERWQKYLERLRAAELNFPVLSRAKSGKKREQSSQRKYGDSLEIEHDQHVIRIRNKHVVLELNKRRGLAIRKLAFPSVTGNEWMIGTIPHGYYDDINLAEDYYCGFLCYNSFIHPNLTDLHPVHVEIRNCADEVLACCRMDTALGPVYKSIGVDRLSGHVRTTYELDWGKLPVGSLRLGNFTFNPVFFDLGSLGYEVCNGGEFREWFPLRGPIKHGDAASFFVSSSHGLGLTDGEIRIGDCSRGIEFHHNYTSNMMLGLVSFSQFDRHPLLRFAYSVREVDETSREFSSTEFYGEHRPLVLSYTIQPAKIER